AEDGIRDFHVTGVQTCALPICESVLRNASSISWLSSLMFCAKVDTRLSADLSLMSIQSPFCICKSCGNVTSPLRSQAHAVTRSDRPKSERKYELTLGSGI